MTGPALNLPAGKRSGAKPAAVTPYRVLRYACPLVSAACLAGGLAVAGQGPAAALALLAASGMLLTRRWPAPWLANASLAAQAALAAYGTQLFAVPLNHAAPLLMLAGATAALAGWDLALDEINHTARRPRDLAADAPPDALLERRHLRALALALGSGLLVAAAGQFVQLSLPFIIIALLVGVGVWALERVLRTMI